MKRGIGLINMVLLGLLLLVPQDVSFGVSFGESEQFHHLQPYAIVIGAMVVIIAIIILVNYSKKS